MKVGITATNDTPEASMEELNRKGRQACYFFDD